MVIKPEVCSPQFGKPSFPTKESFSANKSLPQPCQTEPAYKSPMSREGKSVSLSSTTQYQTTWPWALKQLGVYFLLLSVGPQFWQHSGDGLSLRVLESLKACQGLEDLFQGGALTCPAVEFLFTCGPLPRAPWLTSSPRRWLPKELANSESLVEAESILSVSEPGSHIASVLSLSVSSVH